MRYSIKILPRAEQEIEPTQVIIFSVFHTKQNPRKKFKS